MSTLRDKLYSKKLVTFDLDGTIVSTHALVLEAVNKTLFNIGAYTIESMPEGVDMAHLIDIILGIQGVNPKIKIKDIVNQVFTNYMDLLDNAELSLTPGFRSMIYILKVEKQIPIALCTSTPRRVTEKILNKINATKSFDLLVCGDEVKHPKPNPEIYQKALHHFKVKSHEALAFEDSVDGVTSAINAGIETFVIWDGNTLRPKYPRLAERFFGDFEDVKDVLDVDYDKDLKEFAKKYGPKFGR